MQTKATRSPCENVFSYARKSASRARARTHTHAHRTHSVVLRSPYITPTLHLSNQRDVTNSPSGNRIAPNKINKSSGKNWRLHEDYYNYYVLIPYVKNYLRTRRSRWQSSGRLVIPCRQTDGQANMTKLTIALRNFCERAYNIKPSSPNSSGPAV